MPSARRLLPVLAIALFVAVNAFNALNKGGDAQDFFEGGRKFLDARPLYEESGPASGFIGPPFQAGVFAPFAALAGLSSAAAKLAWYALNLFFLWLGVAGWSRACEVIPHRQARGDRRGRSAWFALMAILLPLQTNFEHQNMNALLLGISGLSAFALVNGRWTRAGVMIGLAAALKVFPALAIVYVAARGWWRCAATAVATAGVLTLLPVIVYGSSFGVLVTTWVRLASGGWPTRGQNQSLIAAIDRLLPAGPDEGVHAARQVPVEFAIYLGAVVVLVGLAVLVARGRKPVLPQIPCELAAVAVASVLLSPVAWDHYWVLLFPAYLLIHVAQDPHLLGRRATALFWTAAILTTGLSRVTLGAQGWSVARHFSTGTLAAIVLYAGLLALWSRLAARVRRPSPAGDVG